VGERGLLRGWPGQRHGGQEQRADEASEGKGADHRHDLDGGITVVATRATSAARRMNAGMCRHPDSNASVSAETARATRRRS
jgi:hypothetical protein